MPRYDASAHDPPAPVTEVGLRRSDDTTTTSATRPLIGGIRLLFDTGADVTLLPRRAVVEGLGLQPQPGDQVELIAFDGTRTTAHAVDLDMIFLNRAFRGRYLLTDEDRGILGRDVLAAVVLLLNGPQQEWSEHRPGP
jgi:hypothetical protein